MNKRRATVLFWTVIIGTFLWAAFAPVLFFVLKFPSRAVISSQYGGGINILDPWTLEAAIAYLLGLVIPPLILAWKLPPDFLSEEERK